MSSSAAPADVGILVEENSISIDTKAKAANRFDIYSTISDNANRDYSTTFKTALRLLPPTERIVLIPLLNDMGGMPVAQEYHASTLTKGFNALSSHHKAKANSIKAAGWKVLIINAKLDYTSTSFGYEGNFGYSDQESSILVAFNEEGKDVTVGAYKLLMQM